jgi:predicted kinase
LLPWQNLCYIQFMREWMRALMRRRGKRGVNDSESTGKIGQEIPVNQPTPLQPTYPVRKPARAPEPSAEDHDLEPVGVAAEEPAPPAPFAAAPAEIAEAAEPAAPAEGKLVVETQPESPSVPPPDPASPSPKDLKGYVVLAIGLPGSGKTTWFKRRGVTPLSSDMLRSILFDDITEQRYQGLVFSTLRSLLRARLIAKMPWNYVDATNLSAHERRQWIKMAKSFGYEAQAVFFDVPLEVCMERNSKRERTVSDDVMRKMAERLRPPSFKEGFSKITMVRVKGAPPLKLDGVVVDPPAGS